MGSHPTAPQHPQYSTTFKQGGSSGLQVSKQQEIGWYSCLPAPCLYSVKSGSMAHCSIVQCETGRHLHWQIFKVTAAVGESLLMLHSGKITKKYLKGSATVCSVTNNWSLLLLPFPSAPALSLLLFLPSPELLQPLTSLLILLRSTHHKRACPV